MHAGEERGGIGYVGLSLRGNGGEGKGGKWKRRGNDLWFANNGMERNGREEEMILDKQKRRGRIVKKWKRLFHRITT